MSKRLLVDDLADPLGWLSSIENTEIRIDAKLSEVLLGDGDLSIELSYGDQILTATLSEKQLKTMTLSEAAAILRKYRGNYLLRALAHRFEDD